MHLLWVLLLGCAVANVVVVEFNENDDPNEFARHHGLEYIGRVFPQDNFYAFKRTDLSRTLRIPIDTWYENQIPRKQYKRVHLQDDPLWEYQWHLHGSASVGLTESATTLTGKDVVIAIVDDGLQQEHPEFASNYITDHSYNFNPDAPISPHDGHGTSAAAVACANAHNGVCGQGVAPKARVAGIRLIAAAVTDLTEALALTHHSNHVDIYSNSWGPADTGRDLQGPGRLVREAFAKFAGGMQGRNGKGTIYVWAAGNGREFKDSCAYDGYAGNPYVNAIGAIDISGRQSWYSEGCANLLAVAPSSGNSRGITTADLLGMAGYSTNECTHTFGGTSSAAPLAAGIFALLLEHNPQLTWRDVRHIVARGATPVDTEHPTWNTNAAGFRHSNAYGFGKLWLPNLLHVMENYTAVPIPQKQSVTERILLNEAIQEGCTQFNVQLNSTGIHFIETAILRVYLTHGRRGNVHIELESPAGTKSVLAERHDDPNADYPTNGWSFSSLHFWGETDSDGMWKARFCDDDAAEQAGKVVWIQIGVFGF